MSAGAPGWARASIARHSKSFALAARLLPTAVAGDAVVLYAWCRRADDAIDLAPRAEQPARLAGLHAEIATVYEGAPAGDAHTGALAEVVARRRIPRAYLDELVAGMAMDVAGVRYADWSVLLRYCYRVAGTVGLMMCHVMGVDDDEALAHAAHLGIAMQLTNVARDVREDWERGRLYLPDDLLAAHGAADLGHALGGALPASARAAVARATAAVVERADAYYRSGDAGLRHLSPRCAFAVRTARLVYSRIGERVRAQGCDPLAGRAVVSGGRKAAAAARATLVLLSVRPARFRAAPRIPTARVDDPARLWLAPHTREGAYAG